MSTRDSALYLELATMIKQSIPQHMLKAPLEGDVVDDVLLIMSMDEGE